MRILVDADSLPVRNRELIARAANRVGWPAIYVANRALPLPPGEGIEMIVADDADEWLAANVRSGELVITRDIPLAARVIDSGATAITDQGEELTSENIGARLSEREIAMRLRAAGALSPSGRQYGLRETQAFANALDRFLTRATRES
jgi:uncharacterized protein YaiI (UPF0178 family)